MWKGENKVCFQRAGCLTFELDHKNTIYIWVSGFINICYFSQGQKETRLSTEEPNPSFFLPQRKIDMVEPTNQHTAETGQAFVNDSRGRHAM